MRIRLYTVRGTKIDLTDLEETKGHPIEVAVMNNVICNVGPKTKAKLNIDSVAWPLTSGRDKAEIMMPAEMVNTLKAEYYDDFAADFDGTHHVYLRHPQGLEIVSGGGYHEPDQELIDAGQKMPDGLNIDVLATNLKATHCVRVPVMNNTQYLAETETAPLLEQSLKSAANPFAVKTKVPTK